MSENSYFYTKEKSKTYKHWKYVHSGKCHPSDTRILHTQKWTGLIQSRACPVNIKNLSSIPQNP